MTLSQTNPRACMPYLASVWAGILALCLALFPSSSRGASPPEAASPGLSFDAFEIIPKRNIFNPNRSKRDAEGPSASSQTERESQDSPATESIALLGTLSYDRGHYAYFDGSRSEYRAILKPSDTIAGYTVADVTVQHVKLKSNTNEVVLPVGMQLSREAQGPWKLAPRELSDRSDQSDKSDPSDRSDRSDDRRSDDRRSSDRFTRSFRASNGSASSNGSSTTNAPAAENEDVLKALMKKREQEMNNENK